MPEDDPRFHDTYKFLRRYREDVYKRQLCSYANYRTSYRRMENFTYTIGPGEWICTLADLQTWFRCRFQHQAVSILDMLERQNCISYSLIGNRKIVKFKITDWPKDNTVLERCV